MIRVYGFNQDLVLTFSMSISSNLPPEQERYSSENSYLLTTLPLLPTTISRLKKSSPVFAKSAKDFGQKINITKTEMVYQPPPGKHDEEEKISINGEILNTVKNFKCFGLTITNNNKLDQELQLRMSKVSQIFGRLRERVWDNGDLTAKAKCAVYQAIVLSTLLYGVES